MPMTDSRGLLPIACAGRKHFDVTPGSVGTARVFCRDKRCNESRDTIAMHTFDLATGKLESTQHLSKWPRPATQPDTDNTAKAS